jgi:hypothetical protein
MKKLLIYAFITGFLLNCGSDDKEEPEPELTVVSIMVKFEDYGEWSSQIAVNAKLNRDIYDDRYNILAVAIPEKLKPSGQSLEKYENMPGFDYKEATHIFASRGPFKLTNIKVNKTYTVLVYGIDLHTKQHSKPVHKYINTTIKKEGDDA